MSQDKINATKDIDWEHRILCADGNCIGIIGMDGRCKECGKIFTGKLPENFGATMDAETIATLPDTVTGDSLLDSQENDEGPDQENEDKDQYQEDEETEDEDELEPDWERRILCIDEKCIGVIGPDGKCKECGRPYEEKHSEPD